MLGREKLATFCMHSASGVRLIYRGWGGSSSLPPWVCQWAPQRCMSSRGVRPGGGEWRTLHRWNFRGGEKNRLRFCIMYCSGQSATIKELIDFWRHPALQNSSANTTVQDFIFFTIWAAARTSTWNSTVTTYGKNLVRFYAQNALKLTYQHLNPPPKKKFRGFRLVYKKRNRKCWKKSKHASQNKTKVTRVKRGKVCVTAVGVMDAPVYEFSECLLEFWRLVHSPWTELEFRTRALYNGILTILWLTLEVRELKWTNRPGYTMRSLVTSVGVTTIYTVTQKNGTSFLLCAPSLMLDTNWLIFFTYNISIPCI